MKLLTPGMSNTKISKGEGGKYLSAILHLAPHTVSGRNACPWASKGCATACLNTAGRGRFDSIQNARIKKTLWFFERRDSFLDQLRKDIAALERKAKRQGLIPVVRLNGTSDIQWENFGIFESFPNVQFYDYTKGFSRLTKTHAPNYHLTFSLNEDNADKALAALKLGFNVAVVFPANAELPKDWMEYKVISGDDNDLRFLDPRGVIIGLKAKGQAKKDAQGFVQKVAV